MKDNGSFRAGLVVGTASTVFLLISFLLFLETCVGPDTSSFAM